jgi:hypothetical protein
VTGLFNVLLATLGVWAQVLLPLISLGSHALGKNVMAIEHTNLHDEEKGMNI